MSGEPPHAAAAGPLPAPAAPHVPAGRPPPATEPLPCPLCEYDLRGLTEPRCPECGYRFNWSDLTDPGKRLHPYLFEHHPEQNVRAFVRTHLNALRPKRFWTSLLPAQPSFPRRLLLYWCVGAALMVPVLVAHYAIWARGYAISTEFERARYVKMFPPGSEPYNRIVDSFGSYKEYQDRVTPVPPSADFFSRAWDDEGGWTLWFAGCLLGWPWATFLSLLVFRISMRRARIKPVHVLRCVLYSFDAIGWVALAVGVAVVHRALLTWPDWPQRSALSARFMPHAPIPTAMPYSYRADMVPDTLFWVGAAALVFMSYRLTSAFRHYLKFDHPVATILASQIIVTLAVVVASVRLAIGG